jgi:hypothetical protein
MNRVLSFNRRYFLPTVILFFTEVLIAMYVNDRFIRPYLGDVLVVMLVYCLVRTFLRLHTVAAAISVLLFAFTVETFQYLHLIAWLGLENSGLARAVLGTSFSWYDIVCYCIGIAIVIVIEHLWKGVRA